MFKSCLLAVGLTLALQAARASDAPTYVVEVVPPPESYSEMSAKGVNDSGHFFGAAANEALTTYVYWSPDSGVVLLTPPVGNTVTIVGINNNDQIAINTTDGPYVWMPIKGWSKVASAAGKAKTLLSSINDNGQMVGYAFDGSGDSGDRSRRAVVWKADGAAEIVQPDYEAVPASIDDRREVVSTVFRDTGGLLNSEAVLLLPGEGYRRLGDLSDNGIGSQSVGVGVSLNGFVAVNSGDENRTPVACVWTKKTGIQSLDLQRSSIAVAISREGTIIGSVSGSQIHGDYPFAWNARWGDIDILEHLEPGSPRFDFVYVSGISGNGIIAASGINAETSNALILMPTGQ